MRGMEDEPGPTERGGSHRGEIAIGSARGRHDGKQQGEEERQAEVQQEEVDAHPQPHPSAIATTTAPAPLRHQGKRTGPLRRPRKEERKQL